ncbi:hypothetical protein TSOC_004029 [Tetrabaena socialis]|uniref:Uncharacterized protein n=1 Tax=Tetrabaena socialis TaxID=47790 RepID=A0A2J8AA03_9CHLO|nr:hypothetical protein TSOC_004029 [Tetrabaena socialis]|eukprot:PNH09356.1 hypothetical protein TSOC_004029 [Tetrabaena socialis]
MRPPALRQASRCQPAAAHETQTRDTPQSPSPPGAHPTKAQYPHLSHQVSLLAGCQNISELLIKSGASTAGVAAIKGRLTCPDCKRLVAQYNL